jgi:hypothetical protein
VPPGKDSDTPQNGHPSQWRDIVSTHLTDNWLIELSEPNMRELLEADESALNRTLDRILATEKDDVYNSFSASI